MKTFMQKIIKSIDNKEQVETLLKQYENEENFINERDAHGDSLLHFASRIQCLPVMKLLIQYGADPEAVNEHGRRPIHEVIESAECVTYLVHQCHVDVNAMKRGDWTPVMSAALKGNLEIVKILVNAGALLNRTTRDGRTALYLAVQEGHIQLSKYLTDQYPQAITQATKSGRLPTQAAAALTCMNQDEGKDTPAYIITTYLLSHTTEPLSTLLLHRDNSGRNILLDSAVSQNLQLLRFLLDHGADPNDSDSLGRNMIHHAAMMGHLNVLKLLNELNVNWDTPDTWDLWTPLMHAARQGHLEVVKYLVETIKVNVVSKDKQGRTAMELAQLWKHDSVVDYLQKVG
ncbi:ankyrin repeat-containing domain protein [Pilaira anomala]|nr:ankyrin repeat-containing domain protein [Pilaira anomala]